MTPLDMHLLPALRLEHLGNGTRSLPTLHILRKLARVLESDDIMETPNLIQARAPVVRPGYEEEKSLQSVSECSHPWIALAAGWKLVGWDSTTSRLGPSVMVQPRGGNSALLYAAQHCGPDRTEGWRGGL